MIPVGEVVVKTSGKVGGPCALSWFFSNCCLSLLLIKLNRIKLHINQHFSIGNNKDSNEKLNSPWLNEGVQRKGTATMVR